MLAPVPLSVEGVESIIHSNPERLSRADVSDELSAADFMSDQSKEFRFRHYPLILLILKNPPLNLVSTEPPQPEKGERNKIVTSRADLYQSGTRESKEVYCIYMTRGAPITSEMESSGRRQG